MRKTTGTVVACVGALMVGTSCTGDREPSARTTTTRPAAVKTLDNVNYGAELAEARRNGETPWWCTSQGLGGHMEHTETGGLAHDHYAGKQKGTLSDADCTELTSQFDQIISLVKPYRTRGDARRAGMRQAVQFVEGLGTHDSIRGFTTMGAPPGAPMFLQYDGEGDDAPLAGLSWFVRSTDAPPEGFPGGNDWWHSHAKLCYVMESGGPVVKGNEISDEQCQGKGGVNISLPGMWMSHAWIIPGWEFPYDVFSGYFNCLKGTGKPPAAGDPCYEDRNDPENPGGGDHDMDDMGDMDHGGHAH